MLFSGLGSAMGRLSLRDAERCGVANGDVEVRIWLVSSAVDSLECRVQTSHTAIKSRGCQRFPLLSALWLVGDSVAVSRRCVWTLDRVMSF